MMMLEGFVAMNSIWRVVVRPSLVVAVITAGPAVEELMSTEASPDVLVAT